MYSRTTEAMKSSAVIEGRVPPLRGFYHAEVGRAVCRLDREVIGGTFPGGMIERMYGAVLLLLRRELRLTERATGDFCGRRVFCTGKDLGEDSTKMGCSK